jgi:hypothetical protein
MENKKTNQAMLESNNKHASKWIRSDCSDQREKCIAFKEIALEYNQQFISLRKKLDQCFRIYDDGFATKSEIHRYYNCTKEAEHTLSSFTLAYFKKFAELNSKY